MWSLDFLKRHKSRKGYFRRIRDQSEREWRAQRGNIGR
jgi:hypothetical protein